MGILLELFFRGLIVNVLGLYTRYYFFKLIAKEKNIDYLLGDKVLKDKTDLIFQHIFNVVIGLIMFTAISFAIAYLVWG